MIPGQRGKCGNLLCSSIFTTDREDIALTQFQKQIHAQESWAVPYLEAFSFINFTYLEECSKPVHPRPFQNFRAK